MLYLVQDGSSKEITSAMKRSQAKDEVSMLRFLPFHFHFLFTFVCEHGKVVCVKFEINTVEEKYLRILRQFGEEAYMEMGVQRPVRE